MSDADKAAAHPIRILHVIHGLPHGGLENGVINLANHLPQPAFEQGICCLDKRGEMADRLPAETPVWVLDRKRHDIGLWFRLAKLIREWRPDIIHCRNWNSWLDAVMARILARHPCRLVWSFHGFAAHDDFPLRRRIVSRILARLSDRLVAVCQDAARRFSRAAGIASERFEVRYNGADLARFQPGDKAALRAELGLPGEARIALTVASLVPIKNHASLLSAISRLTPAVADSSLFVWLGDGAEREALQRQCRQLGLEQRILMPGKTDRVADYLAAADLFILPSRLEGMSNAIVEAMAAGLPVLAGAVGGNPELVVDEETGLLVDPLDADALAGSLSRLLSEPELSKRLGMAARQRAERFFSLPAMMRSYGDLYRGLAHDHDRTGH